MAKKVEAGKSKQNHIAYPRCGLHRKYKGINPPRIKCIVCEDIYELRNGGKK